MEKGIDVFRNPVNCKNKINPIPAIVHMRFRGFRRFVNVKKSLKIEFIIILYLKKININK